MEEEIVFTIETNDRQKDNENLQQRLESYARFLNIITEKGITPYGVSKNTGVATSTLSDWKNGKSMPKSDKMKAISDYIGSSTDFIVYGKTKSESTQMGKEHAELLRMYEMLTSDEKEQILNTMKLFLKNR